MSRVLLSWKGNHTCELVVEHHNLCTVKENYYNYYNVNKSVQFSSSATSHMVMAKDHMEDLQFYVTVNSVVYLYIH